MGNGDARSLDHMTLEALRMRAVRSVQAGERPSAVACALSVPLRTMYGWLARYRHGGWGGLKAKPIRRVNLKILMAGLITGSTAARMRKNIHDLIRSVNVDVIAEAVQSKLWRGRGERWPASLQ